jgi:hypothetical protein
MIEMALRIQNWATKYVEERTKAAASAHKSALASCGYNLRRLIQVGIRQRAPGDVVWPAAHPWTQFKTLPFAAIRSWRKGRGRKPPRKLAINAPQGNAWPKLSRGVTYQTDMQGDQIRVRVGFLSPAKKFAATLAEGQTIPVTAKMRRRIFAAGLMIRSNSIHIPAHPHVEPVYRRNQARIAGFVQQRINAAWAGRDPKGMQPPF